MAHGVFERMIYSYEQPMWHALVEPSLEKKGAERVMVEDFDGGFSIKLAQSAYYTDDGEIIVNDGNFTILRSPYRDDSEWAVFGTCTDMYRPLQPIDIAKRFDECVKVDVETLGFLGRGEDMFISWVLPSFDVRKGDEVKLYSIIRCGFDTKHGGRLFTSAYRPVCRNTVNFAQKWANENSGGNKLVGNVWRGKGTNVNLLEHMGYWMEHLQTNATAEADKVREFFQALANCPISNDAEVSEILASAYPFKNFNEDSIPVQLREKARKENIEHNEGQERIRDGVMKLFKGVGTGITPDLWGVLNATSEYVCHYMPSKKPIAESVMFGNRASITGRMVTVLQKYL